MKEATGELSMTVVVIIAVIAVLGILTALRGPMGEYIQNKWNQMTGMEENEAPTEGWNNGAVGN